MVKARTATKKSKSNAEQPAGEIGAPLRSIAARLGTTDTSFNEMFAFCRSLQYRDSMYQQFKINRYELWALISLYGQLSIKNKVLIGEARFIDSMSGNYGTLAKIKGYVLGLHTLKAITSYEYVHKPGSLSIGITDFGFEILKAYFKEMNMFYNKFEEPPVMNVIHKTASNPVNIPTKYRQSA